MILRSILPFLFIGILASSCKGDSASKATAPAPAPVKTAPPTSVQVDTPTARLEPQKDLVKTQAPIPRKQVKPLPQNKENTPNPVLTVQEATKQEVLPAEPEAAPRPNHQAWSKLLSEYVSANGNVNYKQLKTEKQVLLDYLEMLNNTPPASDWTRDEHMAYWINAYNAATVLLIVEHYPLKSIRDLDGGKTWDVKRIKLGGKSYSLNQIENDILRSRYKDARIHFAVNCAAKGCPPLASKAFLPETLNKQLEERTREFISDKRFNQFEGNKAKLSRIFDWYGSDFGDLRTFLNKYLTNKLPEGSSLEFTEYDWDLNSN
jgi:hypothetical protein